MIEVIKDKLLLLCQREGLDFVPDNNAASSIERFAIAVNAILITGIHSYSVTLLSGVMFCLGKDMDAVVCLICGMTPKIVLSDGNSKVIFNPISRGWGGIHPPKQFLKILLIMLNKRIPRLSDFLCMSITVLFF